MKPKVNEFRHRSWCCSIFLDEKKTFSVGEVQIKRFTPEAFQKLNRPLWGGNFQTEIIETMTGLLTASQNEMFWMNENWKTRFFKRPTYFDRLTSCSTSVSSKYSDTRIAVSVTFCIFIFTFFKTWSNSTWSKWFIHFQLLVTWLMITTLNPHQSVLNPLTFLRPDLPRHGGRLSIGIFFLLFKFSSNEQELYTWSHHFDQVSFWPTFSITWFLIVSSSLIFKWKPLFVILNKAIDLSNQNNIIHVIHEPGLKSRWEGMWLRNF